MSDDVTLAELLQWLVNGLNNEEISEATVFDTMAQLVKENAIIPGGSDESSLADEFDEDQQTVIEQAHDLVYGRHDWAGACRRLADLHELINPLINDRFVFSLTPARVDIDTPEPVIKMHREGDVRPH
jgi:hypothetical protein